MLRDMAVPMHAVASHLQLKEATLESYYYTTVRRHWTIPELCVKHQELLAAKLLVPFVHFDSTRSGSSCKCAELVFQPDLEAGDDSQPEDADVQREG